MFKLRSLRPLIRCLLISLFAVGCNSAATKNESSSASTAKPAPTALATPKAQSWKPGKVIRADDRSFETVAPFVKMAAAMGDRATGAHGTFGIFPGGASSPPHTHTSSYAAVVIKGTMANPFGTEKNAPELAPGSLWQVPSGEVHVTKCLSKEPCWFYFYGDAAFDFAPVKKLTSPRSEAATTVVASAMEWQQVAPFVKMATAVGDRATGAHGSFGEFPGGATSPKHTHSADYSAVVISGTMINPFGDEANPPKMGPGSFWSVPAGTPHITACVSKEPCRFFFHSTAAFDFAPVE